jgi:hypothetical protein
MKMHRRLEEKLHSFLNMALDGKKTALCSCQFCPGESSDEMDVVVYTSIVEDQNA